MDDRKALNIHRLLILLSIAIIIALFLEIRRHGMNLVNEKQDNEKNKEALFIVPSFEGEQGYFLPEIDLIETEKGYILKCDLPGAKKEDIKVSVKGNYLAISASRITEEKTEEGNVYREKERKSGFIKRNILLPGYVDRDGINAEFVDGVLSISLPKRKALDTWEASEVQII